MSTEKYKETIFEEGLTYLIPVKKSESKNYFFRIPFIEGIGYISLDLFFILLGYYIFLGIMWFSLYQYHIIEVSILVFLNVTLSTVFLFRHGRNGKNMFDILKILKRYITKKQVYLIKGKKTKKNINYQL